MVPERDIRAVGDMADPSLGVWFELCKGRNDSVCLGRGVSVCVCVCVLIMFYGRETI